MSLMKAIREFPVPKNSIGIWWFGQNGYIFKSPEGTLASVDLYLTDSCARLYPDVDLHRQVPILLRPEEVDVDVFACTHNHQDHTDPETIRGLRNKQASLFAGPHPSCEVYAREGIETGRIVPTWPDRLVEFRDLKIRGTFALPTDDTDLNHMGCVIQFGTGPKIYITGDTDHHELLYSVARQKPDVVITCINAGFNNLSHFEAAQLCAAVKPRVAIPCHYDMFAINSVDPRMFQASLSIQAAGVKYQELAHGQALLLD